nr:hypothetical protein [Tanacetum cinerariifolium]
LDTFSSVRRPKQSSVIWKKKWSSNTSNVDSSFNNLFIFDDESVRISPVSKMSFRKKPCDSLNVRFKHCPDLFWIIDSGCSKHMTGNRALLTNFMEKFLGTVRFGNNNFAVIASYRDVVIGSTMIKKVYYAEGPRSCFLKVYMLVRKEYGVDLLTGDRSSNLYTISLNEVASNSSACLLAKASSSQSWLWHQRLSHLNFATINNRVKNNREQEKIHRKHHKSKTAFASNKSLYLIHMDLYGPMHVQSINGKRYVSLISSSSLSSDSD